MEKQIIIDDAKVPIFLIRIVLLIYSKMEN